MTFSALDSRLVGPLFATEDMRAAFSDESRLAAMLRMEAALARALAEHGLAPQALASAIGRLSVAEFDVEALGRETAKAGVPVIPFVKAVQAKLPPDLARAFHKGSTTQDVLDTATMLQVREAHAIYLRDVKAIGRALYRLAETHRATPMAGRSHGVQALPITFGHKSAIWLS